MKPEMNLATKKALANIKHAYECYTDNDGIDPDFVGDIQKRLQKANGDKIKMAQKFLADDIKESIDINEDPFVKAAVAAYMGEVDWDAIATWMLAHL